MLVAERFLSSLIQSHGKHLVSTDGERTWYPQTCRLLKLRHHLHLRKVSLKESCNTSRIEPKVLMITFHITKKNAS